MEKENLTAETRRRRDHAADEFRASRKAARFRAPRLHARLHRFSRCLILLAVAILRVSPFLAQGHAPTEAQGAKHARQAPTNSRVEDRILDQLIAHIAVSERALQVVETPSERISKPEAVAPGAPPLLSFRYFEGKERHRFGNLDLVMDDAGH